MGPHPRPVDGRPRHENPAARRLLVKWITLIAEDHGWDAEDVARLADIDGQRTRTILDGVVVLSPAPVLDGILRRLERRHR